MNDAQTLAWRIARRAPTSGLSVVVAPDVASYRQLEEELAFLLGKRLWRFPPWEMPPYDRTPPHPRTVAARLELLARLARGERLEGVLLTALPAWLQRLPPPEAVAASVWRLAPGDRLDLALVETRLIEAGMRRVVRVELEGEFAVRGGILDLWPAGEAAPVRVELWDDEVASSRRFDPTTQRSTEPIQTLSVIPAREALLGESAKKRFVAQFIERFPQHRRHPLVRAVEEGRAHPGLEWLLPLGYARMVRLRDYLPDEAPVLACGDLEAARARLAEQLKQQFAIAQAAREPALPPHELFAVEAGLEAAPLPEDADVEPAPGVADFAERSNPVQALVDGLKQRLAEGWRVVCVAHGPGQLVRMREALAVGGVELADGAWPQNPPPPGRAVGVVGWLAAGFVDREQKLIVLTGREVLGQRPPRVRRRRARTAMDAIASLAELREGDPVVHEVHGVGRFAGVETLETDGVVSDFVRVRYADAEVLVPVEDIGRLHRYAGAESPPLDRLKSERFRKARERTKRDLLAIAHELAELEAKRQSVERPPYRLDGEKLARYEAFVARFPYEETEDQAEAIDAVRRDLSGARPMDRVICGDVGFGKTEVALRAAFIVAASGKQVAVLAPTTVLASQHYQKFADRFAGFGIEVALVSRLQSASEIQRTLAALAEGRVHIVVGTHRLLGDDVRFRDLGLVIVDEEQRFGVRHKTKLAALHAQVDMLTLTATPIPRTLQQTLAGLRDVSVIATPPEGREPIRTVVAPWDMALVREAILRELYRGGQVYYVHNHVRSIQRVAKRLAEEVPEALIGIAHGQMPPRELDQAMMAFYEGRTNVLVCTTIIESGLDVPNANTLIVERADRLGLAQLHQIRGRVGRSGQQAFAYLLTPPVEAMTREARERLQAVATHTELGAGFLIAQRDLEIRGAGNLLGVEQSGHIEEVGLDLYLELVREALAEVKGEPKPVLAACEVRLGASALVPPELAPAAERIEIYRRLAKAESDAELDRLLDEIADRFGKPTPEVEALVLAHRLRIRGMRLGLSSIRWIGHGFRLHFTERTPLDPGFLLAEVQRTPERFRLTPDGNLTVLAEDEETPVEAAHKLRALLDRWMHEVRR